MTGDIQSLVELIDSVDPEGAGWTNQETLALIVEGL